jgi:DNA-binding MarR family transcriptional regulator
MALIIRTARTHPKLTASQVGQARTLYRAGKASQAELARKYKVTQPTMASALTGKTYAWVVSPKPVTKAKRRK